jgi:anti-sigma B factor antagonist
METAIGVFASRDRADEAVRELLTHGVPEQSIVFLTRSENEAKTVAQELGAFVGGFAGGTVGMMAGVTAATLLVPGIGAVFALGFGAATLLGLMAAGTGAAVGKAVTRDDAAAQPTADEKCPDDVAFFREVLQARRSLIVVRTESHEAASGACSILDRLGLGIQGRTPLKMEMATREIDGVTVVDVSGRITLGEGNVMLREIVREFMENGRKRILLNLGGVQYVDSAGVGELVKTYTTVRNQGGQLKLVNLSKRVNDLLQMTRLHAVFDIEKDEAAAIKSFDDHSASEAVAST